ncbi:AMP-binding protein [Nocardioides sp. NPDC057767]|uniref:AMP-binding protein n=1 Tax=unclassified Nocardioides TaxID=2615069 RepID=UPI003672CB2B
METFAQIVVSRAGDDAPGLCFEERTWTWDQVLREGAVRAAALRSAGAAPERRQVHVGVLLENVPDYVFWIVAASLADAVVVGLNASRSAVEIAQDARHADIDLVVTEPRLAHLAADIDGVRIHDIESPGYADWLAPHRSAEVVARSELASPDSLAMLLFSSGSTGAPKAVIVSQGRLGRLTGTIAERIRIRRDSVTYLCMPLFHGNAVMMNLAPAMSRGATVAMTRKFSASGFAADIHRHRATYVNYVGRALSYVLTRPEGPRDRTSTLELAFGTEASEADVRQFGERFGCEVMEGYGLSEGVFRINRTPDTPVGSLGLPAGGVDVRVYDETTGEECPRARFDAGGRLVDATAVGQMVAVGAAPTFEGYYMNPGAMADRVHGDDFWSGDLAYRDEAGYFYFAGRSSDWLRVDSENFSAAPVERVIQRLPWVAAAPVYAVPDPRTGDNVMVAIELEPSCSFDPAAFGEFLAAQPDFGAKWWPTYVRVVDRMPLTGSGKIDKAPLRRAAWQTADPVWVRVGRTATYEPLDAEGRSRITAETAMHRGGAQAPTH